jgi:hypothetical protein
MRFKLSPDGRGYVLWLSARDTYSWAHKPGAAWPCSTLSDRRLVVVCDSNGLCDFTSDGKTAPDDIDGAELCAIVADHLPPAARHLWPVWAAAPAVA